MAEKEKIGAGHASAMWRSGLKELGQVMPAFPASSVQPVEELGLAGNLPAHTSRDNDNSFDKARQAFAGRGCGQEIDRAIER